MSRALVALGALALLAGCTSQGRFEAGQALGRSKADCEALTSNAARERCEADFTMSHEDYARERAALRDQG